MKRIVCVIPARLHSTRFPKKVLSFLGGKPLLQWVYEAARGSGYFDDILFAVDALETRQLIEGFCDRIVMTSEACINGTERLIEVQRQGKSQADVWVNWQADEPFISKTMIGCLLQSVHEEGEIWTLKKVITEKEQYRDPHVVKVVVDHKEEALFFSRSPIPYRREGERAAYKHLGIYAFSDAALRKIATLAPCELEKSESLEQLRWLYHGMRLRVHTTEEQSLGIDLAEHLVQAEEKLFKLLSSS
ncbi:MAG: 3-deoxy-manno-octulosonate cytidylyltransferase [Chlamydiae bacterium]|nr:3-deoxy-manno-octulosonate cytidylyltransferase [Chlamydiota bacterium]